MRTILCFGDSNTYGYRPDTGERYAEDTRWTGILREKLKDRKIEVIEEGLVGRTTVFEDSIRPGRKGIDYLVPLLETHAPVDQLVLMLGTNDCKSIYKASPEVIGLGIERLIKGARAFNPKLEILLISPIYLGDDVWKEEYDPEFDQESVQTSKKLKDIYKKMAKKYDCQFLAASDVAAPSIVDQEHLNEEGHRALANAVLQKIIEQQIEKIISNEISISSDNLK